MGCKHCFVVDRLEELVGEGDSRSAWRTHEHENVQLVSQRNVTIRIFWNRFHIERFDCEHTTGLPVLCAEFTCCQCTKLIHFLTCTGIPCRVSHCENGLVRCCLYKILTRHIDTKHQLADILNNGNFTRGSHFSFLCCTKKFSLISCSTVAKWIQEQKEEERVVSKPRLAVMNLSSSIATSSSTASSPIASKSPGTAIASGKPDRFDAASTSQVRLKGAYLGGLMEKQRENPSHQEEEDSEDCDNSYGETRCPKQ